MLPYGGMTRIRFKGFISLQAETTICRPLAMSAKLRESGNKCKIKHGFFRLIFAGTP
jgi:hypothetical protein